MLEGSGSERPRREEGEASLRERATVAGAAAETQDNQLDVTTNSESSARKLEQRFAPAAWLALLTVCC